MKRTSKIRHLLTALLFALALTAIPAGVTGPVEAKAAVTKAAVKNGWKKESVGYCYYKNGKKQKNKWISVGGKRYCLGANGARKTGWYTSRNKSYYFDSKGVYTGKNKKIDASLVKAMDKAIKNAGVTPSKITSAASAKAAVKKLAVYAEKNYGYARAMGFKGQKGWENTFAKQMFSSKKGSCYHYAAALAVMAKRATGYPVRVCWGTSNAFNAKRWQPHAWMEIKIGKTWYTYDANAAKFSTLRKGKWYLQKHNSMEKKVYRTQKYVNVEL